RRRARVPVLVQRRAGDSRARPLAGTAPLTTQTLRGCFLTALLVAACAPAMATQISVDPRVEEEVGRGRSRVLVELRLPCGVRPHARRARGRPVAAAPRRRARGSSCGTAGTSRAAARARA